MKFSIKGILVAVVITIVAMAIVARVKPIRDIVGL
jgi:hypothetical protein